MGFLMKHQWKTTVLLLFLLHISFIWLQTDGPVPVHPGRGGGDDEVVPAQRGVRASRERLRDLPQVLVEEPPLHQHPLPRRTDGEHRVFYRTYLPATLKYPDQVDISVKFTIIFFYSLCTKIRYVVFVWKKENIQLFILTLIRIFIKILYHFC